MGKHKQAGVALFHNRLQRSDGNGALFSSAVLGADMRRVLVTGSRNLADSTPVYEALWAQARIAGGVDQLTVIEGRCPYGGADLHAQRFCELYGATNEPYPALWEVPCIDERGAHCRHMRRRTNGVIYYSCAGFIRNQRMVDTGAHVCLAFPRGESKGTRDCAKRAKAAGIPVIFG